MGSVFADSVDEGVAESEVTSAPMGTDDALVGLPLAG